MGRGGGGLGGMFTLFTALTFVRLFQKSKCSKCSLTFPESAVGTILRGRGKEGGELFWMG